MGLVDGLGFEEIGQAGSQPSQIWVTGSITAQSNIQSAGNISGAGNIFGVSGTFTSNISAVSGLFTGHLKDVSGLVAGVGMASGTTFGYNKVAGTFGNIIQVGAATTSAGSGVWIVFPKAFAGSYVLLSNLQTLTSTVGSEQATISGILYGGSCFLIGQAGANYMWLAAGPSTAY